MKNFRYAVSFMMVFALTLVFIGCAKPPQAERSDAKAALDAALAANADKYAATGFNAAKNLWVAAEDKMNTKKYAEAKQDYINAKLAFEKLRPAIDEGKSIMIHKLNEDIPLLEEDWKNLVASAKNLKNKMKDKKEAWAADTKTFEDGLFAAKGMNTDPVGATAKVAELRAIIDKWSATFKELGAAPAKK